MHSHAEERRRTGCEDRSVCRRLAPHRQATASVAVPGPQQADPVVTTQIISAVYLRTNA